MSTGTRSRRTTISMDKKPLSPEDLKIPAHLAAVLKVIDGPASKEVFTLTASASVVGRGEVADIRVKDPAMSRRHFQITYRNLEFRIQDLESSNGTYLNDSEVEEYALRNGDEIVAGDSRFVFSVGRAEAPKR
ncbi:MAG: FHA domain-containing protein [bacterium]